MSASLPGLVDIHTHAVSPELAAPAPGQWPRVERIAPNRAVVFVGDTTYREIDDRCWSAERRLADMDADGVAAQCVSPMPITLCHDMPADPAAALAAAQNDFLAGLCAVAPDRLLALGAVPLQHVQRSVEELRRCVLELGFVGVEIGTVVGGTELADPVLDPFFDEAAHLGAFVLVHPVDTAVPRRITDLGLGFGLGMPSETGLAGAGLVTGPVRQPGAAICLAHGGGVLPQILPRLDRGSAMADGDAVPPTVRVREMWCDTLTYDAPSLRLSIERFGAGHVLLGTDYPFAARETPAGAVLDDLDDGLRAALGQHNARRLLEVRPRSMGATT